MRHQRIATRRSGVILAAIGTALLLLAPAAIADEEASEDPDASETEQGDDEEADGEAAEEGSSEELTTQPVEDICDGVIFRVTPNDLEGDDTAVAITSQQLDADVDGWTQVSWEVNEGTELTGITLRTEAGTTTLVSDLEAGTVEDVLELYFCGTSAGEPSDGEEPVEEPAEEPEPVEEPAEEPLEAPEPVEEPEAVEQPSNSGTTSGNNTAPSSGNDHGSDEAVTSTSEEDVVEEVEVEEEAAETEPTETPETASDEGADEGESAAPAEDDTEVAEDDDTEVLGVTLTRDEEAGGSWLPGAIAVVLLLLLGVGGFAAYQTGLIGGNR